MIPPTRIAVYERPSFVSGPAPQSLAQREPLAQCRNIVREAHRIGPVNAELRGDFEHQGRLIQAGPWSKNGLLLLGIK